jgi:hypothetical protein
LARRPRLVHRPWFIAGAGATAAAYLRAVARTGRFEEIFDPTTVATVAGDTPVVGAFWHQRILMIPALWRRMQLRAGHDRPVAAIVSAHGDGELIARTLARLGVEGVRGSTSRGGTRAARAALEASARGRALAVVVDGPRGPHAHVHPGAVFLAKATGAPLVPITFAVDRKLHAPSWDRLLIPLPFARGRFVTGEPLHLGADAGRRELEAARLELARRLRLLNEAADAPFGGER